jgi:flavin reductase (DIM6/NTAB) family NADH-FMN oxidoreductase RutF
LHVNPKAPARRGKVARRPAPGTHARCTADLECKVVDGRMVNAYNNFFVREVVHAWSEPGRKEVRTIHHRGRGVFMFAGPTLRLPSRMK